MRNDIRHTVEILIKEVKACIVDDEIQSYKASPILKKIDEFLGLNLDDELDTLQFLYDTYYFIGEMYRRMGRMSVAAIHEEKALDYALKLYHNYEIKIKYVDDLLYKIMRDRNFYVNDECYDVLDKVRSSHMIDPNVIEQIDGRVKNNRRSLKHDPVEMSKEYLAVIDEVEEKIEQNRTLRGMGSCHEIWALKAEYLAEKGITWRSPSMLNPNVMFD